MSGHGKPWPTKHQLLDKMRVLQRPVEFATQSGRKQIMQETAAAGKS
jgi:hypothetical protein